MANISFRVFILLTTILLADGCATMDQAECVSADWYALGLGDGEQGRKSSHYSKYRKECSTFGVNVDSSAYGDGWKAGIRSYCTRDNGYRVGIGGWIYQHSCPAKAEDTFFSAYQAGRGIFLKQMRVNALRRQVQKFGDDLAKSDLSEKQRGSLAEKRKRLKRDLELASISLALTTAEARKHGFNTS